MNSYEYVERDKKNGAKTMSFILLIGMALCVAAIAAAVGQNAFITAALNEGGPLVLTADFNNLVFGSLVASSIAAVIFTLIGVFLWQECNKRIDKKTNEFLMKMKRKDKR